MNASQPESTLPALRPELQLMPGIREINGLRTWVLFDPLRHQYFQIDHKGQAILSLWHIGDANQIANKLQYKSVTLEDIKSLLLFLWSNSLTTTPPKNDNHFYTNHSINNKKHWLVRVLHGYISFFLPLFRPEKFLRKTEPLSRLFFTRFWWVFIAVVAVLGVYLTLRQWDQFIHTFMHFFSLKGLIYYAIALVFIKMAHELGHAYAAARYGCRVKSIGVAFIVMLPILYTDTTDSWKLTSRRKRLIICGAGVAVELSIAAIATLIWAVVADGPLRSTAFFVATTSWIMSILVNTNPLMRFDGYHFLSDLLGVQNLQGRSFAIGRWSMRKILFNLAPPAPEALSSNWIKGLTLFAWATWIYRFFLFLGIALIVHQLFFKPFGALLAAVEIGFFIAIPIMNELKQWYKQTWSIVTSPTSWLSFALLAGLLFTLIFPWQSTIRIPAILEPAQMTELYAPSTSQLAEVSVNHGDEVHKGDTLFVLKSNALTSKSHLVQREIDLRQAMLNRIAADNQDLEQSIILKSELKRFEEELAGLTKQLDQLTIRAPISGRVSNLKRDIHNERWLSDGEHLVTINSLNGAKVRGFVERNNLARINNGTEVVFIPDVPELEKLEGRVELVESANADTLNIAALASYYGGPIAVNYKNEQLEPLKSWYHISIQASEYPHYVSQQRRGVVLAEGEPESLIKRIWRRVFHVALREVII